jgi:hypothetical protein
VTSQPQFGTKHNTNYTGCFYHLTLPFLHNFFVIEHYDTFAELPTHLGNFIMLHKLISCDVSEDHQHCKNEEQILLEFL